MEKNYIDKVMADFDKKFTLGSFTWNGDNATGADFAANTRRKLRLFIRNALKKSNH